MTTANPPALIRVLGDEWLFHHITTFQRGMDMPLLTFWRAHCPETPLRFDKATGSTLVELLVQHGSLRLLRMAERVQITMYSQSPFRSQFGGPPLYPIYKLPVERVADLALQHNRVDVLEWALLSQCATIGDLSRAWGDAIKRAGQDGDLCTLEILREHAPLPITAQEYIGMRVPVDMKHVAVLRFAADALPAMRTSVPMVALAAANLDRPLLEQLHARPLELARGFSFGAESTRSSNFIRVDKALTARDLGIIEFLLEHFHQHLAPCDVVELASHADPEIHRMALRFAGSLQCGCMKQIEGGSVDSDVVRHWVDTGIFSSQWPVSIDKIAQNGMLDMARLLHDKGIATATTDAMDRAAENAHWEMVEFLHFNRKEGCTTRTMDAAIQQANIKYARFLLDHRTEGFSPLAARRAVMMQRSTVGLRFLHEHTDFAFTPEVMDTAAEWGNLPAIRFLHENRSEGCTTAAMDNAVSKGYLRIVQYLHTHRSEGCTVAALRDAVEKGSVDMVRFLFQNYRHLFDHHEFSQAFVTNIISTWRYWWQSRRDCIEFLFHHFPNVFAPVLRCELLVKGMFDVYKGLQSRCSGYSLFICASESEVIGEALYDAGRTFELGTIRYIVNELGRRDLAHRAMDGAANAKYCGTHWLRAVYAVTGPQSCRLSALHVAAQHSMVKRGSLDRVKFLVRHCCEPDALQNAVEMIPSNVDGAVATELRNWDPTTDADDELPLHPFLLDPRVSSWAIDELFPCHVQHIGSKWPTWAAAAAYKHDLAMLEVIRDTPAVVDHTHASHGGTLDAETTAQLLRFDGAAAVAIQARCLKVLQWILAHVDGPVDPTLLGEALFNDSREIAEWLVEHQPEACISVQWEPPTDFFSGTFHLTEDVAYWLEHTPAVLAALDFAGIVRYLIQQDDVESLRWLHKLDPKRVVASRELEALARQSKRAKVQGFFSEIESADA